MTEESHGLNCPFCGHDEFEKIHIGLGEPIRWWRPGEIGRRLILMMAGKMDVYRCQRCRFVMIFARD